MENLEKVLDAEIRKKKEIFDKIYDIVSEIDQQDIARFRDSLPSEVKRRVFDESEFGEQLRIIALAKLSEEEIASITDDEVHHYLPGLHDVRQTILIMKFVKS